PPPQRHRRCLSGAAGGGRARGGRRCRGRALLRDERPAAGSRIPQQSPPPRDVGAAALERRSDVKVIRWGRVGLALAVFAAPAPAQEGDAVAKALEAARVERGAGRLTEAETILRDALHGSWSPALGLELGGVLADRAVALEGTSELMKSLR